MSNIAPIAGTQIPRTQSAEPHVKYNFAALIAPDHIEEAFNTHPFGVGPIIYSLHDYNPNELFQALADEQLASRTRAVLFRSISEIPDPRVLDFALNELKKEIEPEWLCLLVDVFQAIDNDLSRLRNDDIPSCIVFPRETSSIIKEASYRAMVAMATLPVFELNDTSDHFKSAKFVFLERASADDLSAASRVLKFTIEGDGKNSLATLSNALHLVKQLVRHNWPFINDVNAIQETIGALKQYGELTPKTGSMAAIMQKGALHCIVIRAMLGDRTSINEAQSRVSEKRYPWLIDQLKDSLTDQSKYWEERGQNSLFLQNGMALAKEVLAVFP